MSQLPTKIQWIGRTYLFLAMANLLLAWVCYQEMGHDGMVGEVLDLLLGIACVISLISGGLFALVGPFLLRGKRPALLAAIMLSSASAAWHGFFLLDFLSNATDSLECLVLSAFLGALCLFHACAAGYMTFSREVRQAFRR